MTLEWLNVRNTVNQVLVRDTNTLRGNLQIYLGLYKRGDAEKHPFFFAFNFLKYQQEYLDR